MAIAESTRKRYEKAKNNYDLFIRLYPLTVETLPDEVWKPIQNFEHFHVSNYGRVKALKNGNVKIYKPLFKQGYLATGLYKNGQEKRFYIHRLVAKAFIPNPDGKPQINHIDGCKLNNYVGNLEWCTRSENVRHAVATGLRQSPQGEIVYNAKLTADDVIQIRENNQSLSQDQLAEKFGVTKATIGDVQLGKKYKNVSGFIRPKMKGGSPRLPDNIRTQIKAEFKKGDKNFGSHALAKKYGCSKTTILNIVNEK